MGSRRQEAAKVEGLDRRRLDLAAGGKRLELHRRVHGAFALALYQERAHQLRGELANSAEQTVRLTRIRVESGDAVPTDLARVEAELAGARAEWQRSDLMRRQALRALSTTIGLPDGDVREVQGSLDSTLEIPALTELTAELATYPAMASAGADLAAREAGVSLSKVRRNDSWETHAKARSRRERRNYLRDDSPTLGCAWLASFRSRPFSGFPSRLRALA